MSGPSETRSPELMEGLVHRVEGFWRTGKNAELDKAMELVRQARVFRVTRLKHFPVLQPQLGDGHPVFGQGARLVGTQHCRGAQRLDRGRSPRQNTRPRDSPCPHGHEHSEHDRKFFG